MKLVRFRYKNSVYKGAFSDNKITVDFPDGKQEEVKLGEVTLLAPAEPTKIVSVGLNYKDHAEELDMAVPEEPVIFIKPSTAVIGPEDAIFYPRGSVRVDYEAELGIVIKDRTRNVSADEAASHIEGYTCFNDVTARDLQKKDIQWSRAKSFDTFAPVGPWIETDLDPGNLKIRAFLNGELKQDSSTAEFIFSVPELVSFISGVMTLLPGDIVSTGTPPNVGPMEPEDEVVVEIEGIGYLRNRVEYESGSAEG
ncbi:MAG: fumarylacetoacetate hydrolase family protein [Candidatus Omnitrophota bacterium]